MAASEGVRVIKIPWDIWALHHDSILEHFDELKVCAKRQLEEIPEFCADAVDHEGQHGWEVTKLIEMQFSL